MLLSHIESIGLSAVRDGDGWRPFFPNARLSINDRAFAAFEADRPLGDLGDAFLALIDADSQVCPLCKSELGAEGVTHIHDEYARERAELRGLFTAAKRDASEAEFAVCLAGKQAPAEAATFNCAKAASSLQGAQRTAKLQECLLGSLKPDHRRQLDC